MSLKRIFVVVPSMTPAGPVKGAIALCNGLVERGVSVTLVSVKDEGNAGPLGLDPRAASVGLGAHRSYRAKVAAYKQVLASAGRSDELTSISMCFSADFVNSWMGGHAHIVSSVRGNLFVNYRYDYGGWHGVLFGVMHLLMLHRFDGVIAMSAGMAAQLRKVLLRRIVIIPNFIDERGLVPVSPRSAREGGRALRFVFVGNLNPRKRPDLLVEVARAMQERGTPIEMQFVGNGSMRADLEERARGLVGGVVFHGHLSDPFPVLRSADYMILPSESEGTSRAVLEALFLGIPCVVRRVDSNEDVIQQGRNGFLFDTDQDLFRLVESLVDGSLVLSEPRGELLPEAFRQGPNVDAFLRVARAGEEGMIRNRVLA